MFEASNSLMRQSLRTIVLLACLATTAASAQLTPASSAPLSVYLDCEFQGCDFDYFRTELTMVNWVRDRQVADVHILVTTQSTGSGGREYSVNFLGLRQFAGLVDTLKYVSPPAATEDERRKGLARVFRAGLVRYLARTPAADRVTISYKADSSASAQTKPKSDRWNYWVFRTSLNGSTNGEKTYNSFNLYGNVNADRVTERWKTRLNGYQQYNQSEFEIDPAQPKFVNIQRSYGGSILQVKSLTQHWSAGMRVNLSSSTYNNSRRVIRLFPAVEYNLFPYSQSTRRQLRLEYNAGWATYAYRDTTINDKLEESMPLQRLVMTLATREPWGSIDIGSAATSYFNGRGEYRIGTFSELSLRLFKGFSLNGFGEYTMIRDQFALAKKNFSPAEILTRQFQRGTGYRFFGFFGLSYTFGSIFNNVVNPRMSGGFFD